MDVKKEGNKVIITVELEAPRSSSTGNSQILFTSKGFQYSEGIGVNLNIIKSKR